MEATMLWGVAAALAGLASGVAIGRAVGSFIRRRRVAASIAESGQGNALAPFRRGLAPVVPLARLLMRLDAVGKVARDLSTLTGGGASREASVAALSWVACAVLAAGAASSAMSSSAVCGIAVGCCVAFAVFAAVRSWQEKRVVAMREAVPDVLRAMESCFRAGLSLSQTLGQVSREAAGPLGSLFGVAARRLEMGGTPGEALAVLRGNRRVPELSFVAVALDVQHQCGGSIAPVLTSAREAVESDLELMRSLRVQTAQAKLSAQIVTIMPFVLIALFSLISSDFLSPFFGSAAGVALLALALGMQAAGVLTVRHMLRAGSEA